MLPQLDATGANDEGGDCERRQQCDECSSGECRARGTKRQPDREGSQTDEAERQLHAQEAEVTIGDSRILGNGGGELAVEDPPQQFCKCVHGFG